MLPLNGVHVSRTLRRTLRSGRFTCTADREFADVVAGCTEGRRDGTWITPEMAQAYERLHELGHAHSIEVWDAEQRLVGGIYGVTVGGAFCGESMFHRVTDASKVALVELARHLSARGFELFDVQLPTPHLESMGAVTIRRVQFLRLLRHAVQLSVRF